MESYREKEYRNVFAEIGKGDAEIQQRLEELVDTFFYREGRSFTFL